MIEINETNMAIVQLMQRAAVLTPTEVKQLDVARSSARSSAWYAVSDAMSAAGRDAVCDVVRAAAITTAWNAGWDSMSPVERGVVASVVNDVAEALMMRDMIGKNGFEQHHYDLLIKPWATVIGPAHPDDNHCI